MQDWATGKSEMTDESNATVLARLDANVNNLISQVQDIRMTQRDLVTRERLEIETKAREAAESRIQASLERARTEREKNTTRIESLERGQSWARGAVYVLGAIGLIALTILSSLVGHLYFK